MLRQSGLPDPLLATLCKRNIKRVHYETKNEKNMIIERGRASAAYAEDAGGRVWHLYCTVA